MTIPLPCRYCGGKLFTNYKGKPAFAKCIRCSRVQWIKPSAKT